MCPVFDGILNCNTNQTLTHNCICSRSISSDIKEKITQGYKGQDVSDRQTDACH